MTPRPSLSRVQQTAYLHFCDDVRNTVKEENPGKQPNWIMKELGERWNALPDKSKYEELHKDDVARFQRECKEAGVDEDDPRLKRQRTPKKPKGEGEAGEKKELENKAGGSKASAKVAPEAPAPTPEAPTPA